MALFIGAQWRHRLGSKENRGFYELHLTPPVFYLNFGDVSVASDRPCWSQREQGPYAIRRCNYFRSIPTVWKSYLNVTDGQTTCNLIMITALCVASCGNKRYISAYTLSLETTTTGLHFAADNLGLYSLKFFWWVPEFLFISARGAFRPLGHPKSLTLVPIASAYVTSY